ncbi:Carboxylesterase [Ancylostoma caninum]|uniref:Carboxylic ester hydrolase n=1 Tax=Ancylostoma caninum TaxID=29170 RepID=A0A368FCF2_ANCCA|nr:Carboxylesterase [Ancylostoma caninum]
MGNIVSFLSFRKTDTTRPSRQVRTRYGIVEGFRLDIGSGKDVDLFLGIPFAAPPVDELRFKKPQPPEKWEDVRKCVSFGPRAPQSDFFWERITLGRKSEDCLYLNVFTPAWKPDDEEAGHTVMVYVHGGGYLIDSAVKYGDKGIAKYLCRHDVVVVTIQYRLGLLGFFSTGDAVCDGNLGLWDMTMALQWVQDNISAFGGNPNKVTVFGQSAGGASVDMLALSPHSRDLFHQVAPMAGNAECTWSTVCRSRLVESCREFARRRGWEGSSYDIQTSQNLVEFLRHRKVREFEKRLISAKGMDVSKIGLDLAPIIGTCPEDFLPKSIDELRAEAPKKKCLIGTCQHEGLLFATLSPSHFNIRGLDKLLSVVITPENHGNYEDLRRQARELYLSGVNLDNKVEVARAYVKLYSDLFVNNGTYNYVKKMTELGNRVYLYSFEFFNPQSFGILSIRMPFKGATHCTELTYLFGVSIVFGFQFTEADNKMIDLMTRLWTNFAKYGNPNGPYEDSTVFDFMWEPTTKEDFSRYLRINENCEMRSNYEDRRAEFWKNIRITSKGT